MAKTPVRRLIEKGIEAGADYIPDVIETPLRKAFSIDVPKPKASKPKASLAVTPKPKASLAVKPKPKALPAPPKPLALPAPGPGLPPFAVKPKGGQWWADKTIIHGNNSPEAAARESASYLDAIIEGFGEADRPFASADLTAAPVWLQRALTKYLKNDFGTPEDPLRDLAARGLHYDAHMTPEAWDRMVNSKLIKSPIGDVLFPSNSAGGMPGAGSDLRGEAMTAMPWLAKLPVTDNIYGIHHQGLNLDHFTDELYNALNAGSAGLPPHLAVRPESLDRMTFPQAAEHVGKINQFRAKEMLRAGSSTLNNPAVQTFKEYADDNPMGLRWVQLKAPDDIPEGYSVRQGDDAPREGWFGVYGPDDQPIVWAPTEDQARRSAAKAPLQQALKYEGDTMGHCVGGYCDDVMSGQTRIFSLRDAKGEPHVTIETRAGDQSDAYHQAIAELRDTPLWGDWLEHQRTSDTRSKGGSLIDYMNAFREGKGLPSLDVITPDEIVQIKGKQNRAPKDDYLPFVQDFVKSGQWGNVGDLGNTGLVKLPDGRYITPQQAEEVISAIPETTEMVRAFASRDMVPMRRVYDPTGLDRLDPEEWQAISQYFEGYAIGGRVSADRCFSKGKSAVYAVNKSRK